MTAVRTFLAQRRKAAWGIAAVLLAWGPVAQEAGFHAKEWWALAAALAGVFGIHTATNDTAGGG